MHRDFAIAALLLVAAMAFPCGAVAAEPDRKLEFGPYFGYFDFDSATRFEDFGLFGARLGARVETWLTLEVGFDEVYTERQVSGNSARQMTFSLYGRIEPWRARVTPYLLGGLAFVMFDDTDDPDAFGDASDIGFGGHWSLREGWLLRAEFLLRRQRMELLRASFDADGARVLEEVGPRTLWGRSWRVGVSRVF